MASGKKKEQKILQQRNRELAILNKIARSLNGEIDLKQTLEATLQQVAELLNLETGWIWIVNEDSGETELAAAQNLPPALTDNPDWMHGDCYCLGTYFSGNMEGAANVNFITCSRLKNLLSGTDGLLFHASIPLYAQEKKLGVMNVASRDWRELSTEDLQLLYTIGDLLGIAIERARLSAASVNHAIIEERNRLAREIHDTLAQGLAGIVLRLEAADALAEKHDMQEKLQSVIQQALQQTRFNLEEARRSVLDLRAAPLSGKTLAEALENLLAESAAGGGFAARFRHNGESKNLSSRIDNGVFRIAQEALNNIRSHARAENVEMTLFYEEDMMRLIIRDDGAGFDVDKGKSDRFGLVGMNERARLLGGTLDIRSCPGQGVDITFEVPL